jgi:predicted metal-dependent phosphoesterase TrpH
MQIYILFLQERIPMSLSAAETIDLIHGQGGLAVAPHPFSYLCPCLGKKILQEADCTLQMGGV